MDYFLGTVVAFGYNWPPTGWAQCNGQLLSISQYGALFSLLGNVYGGNGITTFALPDLQNAAVPGAGQGPGLSNYIPGQSGGTNSVSPTTANLPLHAHMLTIELNAVSAAGTLNTPGGNYPAGIAAAADSIYNTTMNGSMMSGEAFVTMNAAGVAAPNDFSIQRPYMFCNYCIAIAGLLPSRS
jgi:microcystin-dependent protein